MLPSTSRRVIDHTRPEINEKIARHAEANIAKHIGDSPEAITARLAHLDQEWDVERILEVSASALVVLGILLALISSWSWLILSLAVGALLFLHALQGWCPSVPLLRRLGVRTEAEINEERYALKVQRGDFAGLPRPEADPETQAVELLRAARKS
jgi:hypothetical protein